VSDIHQYIQTSFGLPHESVSKVASLFEQATLQKGEYYTKTGQFCDKMSFIQSGYIRIFEYSGTKEITQWISSPGHFITDLSSFIFQQRARRNMQALTDCTLFTIKGDAYKTLHEVVPNWPQLEKRFISDCFMTLEDRIFSHLSLSAEERYDLFFEQHKALFNEVPLQYLASMLGMSPETFSRIRAKKLS
tara:strand:- start:145 stop:714 length:570 start_codon:yes stop_codon:yes gene_type:complete